MCLIAIFIQNTYVKCSPHVRGAYFYGIAASKVETNFRSTDYRWQRGGNSSNSCTVLSLLGQPCELLTCLCADEHGYFLQNDLRKYKIDYCHCPMMPLTFGCPVSTIILSSSTGSRTIIHHKASNFPELTFKDFEALDLEEYSWIHFEVYLATWKLIPQRDYYFLLSGAEFRPSVNYDTTCEKL